MQDRLIWPIKLVLYWKQLNYGDKATLMGKETMVKAKQFRLQEKSDMQLKLIWLINLVLCWKQLNYGDKTTLLGKETVVKAKQFKP
jgi:hypothetical protein